MKLQNVKNYLIFLIAVSHMLYSGYHAEEKVYEETEEVMSSLSHPDSTWAEDSADSIRLPIEAGKLEKPNAVGSTATGTSGSESMASEQGEALMSSR